MTSTWRGWLFDLNFTFTTHMHRNRVCIYHALALHFSNRLNQSVVIDLSLKQIWTTFTLSYMHFKIVLLMLLKCKYKNWWYLVRDIYKKIKYVRKSFLKTNQVKGHHQGIRTHKGSNSDICLSLYVGIYVVILTLSCKNDVHIMWCNKFLS